MKINKIKINSYGKINNKEIDLENGINIIYGQNEAGKSTLINFIKNSFYGISKNKNGKELSDYDRYKPWIGEEFSGKIQYELDNKEEYEVFRDFNKKNPQIFNEKMEDISKKFNIDKSKGNEFFIEQTKIDEDLFLSTLAINQNQVILENKEQNLLIQKIANLAQTGDDTVSFKRVIDRINRRQLDEVGSERSREKPINILTRNINDLETEKEKLEKYKDFKYEFEEKQNILQDEIYKLENELEKNKKLKIDAEKEKIENEKIKIQENILNENNKKINEINTEIEKIKKEKNNKKTIILNVILLLIFLINIIQFILIKNKLIKYVFLLTIPIFLLFYSLSIIKEKNNKKMIIKNLKNQKNILEENNSEIEKQINNLKIKNTNVNNLEQINYEIEKTQKEINEKKLELHALDLDKKNIEPELDNLSKIEEELVSNNEKMSTLKDFNESFELAKEVLNQAYEKMKNSVTPRFTENLSKNINKITNGKYNKVMFNEEKGLIVELENGNYIPSNRLSVGTIDQLYLSLRLSMIDDLSEEKVPIFLDEAFAFYDDNRLKNILFYINEEYDDRQAIIFTCTNREKEILEKNNIKFNLVQL